MTPKFILFFIVIYGCLGFGYGMKRICPELTRHSRPLTTFFMTFFVPLIILNAFWSIELKSTLIISLPLILVVLQSLSLIPALLLSRALHLDREETGSFVSCSIFSNVGATLGIFLCFILYGDEGLYLSSWYITLFIPYYYFIGFPLMGLIGGERRFRMRDIMVELTQNPVSIVPISFMAIGMSMNLTGIQRPEIVNRIVTRYLTYILVAGYSFAIGLSLNFHRSVKYVKHSLFISVIKFLYNPLTSYLLLSLFGYLKMEGGLPSKVVIVESFMPTAIMSVMLVKVFRLNDDLANAAWILSSFLVIPMIPVMFYVQGVL